MAISLYLDTSVISTFHNEADKERMLTTRDFWAGLEQYEVFISDLTLKEIRQTPDDTKRSLMEKLAAPFQVLIETEEARRLAQWYVDAYIFTPRWISDARHVAIAVIYRVDVLVSWNFRHLVKVSTIQKVNSVNLQYGYRLIDIRSPLEL